VWVVLADVEGWPIWTRSVRTVELLDEALAAGARVQVRQPKFPKVVWHVSALEPGRSFSWESNSPGASAAGFHTLIDKQDGTTTTVLRISQTGPVGSAVGFVTRSLTKRYVAMEAEGLRAKSESLRESFGDPWGVWS
jgi:uncharacterized membrane protein